MLPYVALHLGLHCLPKYLFTSIKNEKGKNQLVVQLSDTFFIFQNNAKNHGVFFFSEFC